jgi:hypothetical protein
MIPEKYLPLGTIVLLKDAKKKMMIIGYEIETEDENRTIYNYMGCLYPEGFIEDNVHLLFNHEQIGQVIFMGFSNEESIELHKVLKELVNKRNNKEKKIVPFGNSSYTEN